MADSSVPNAVVQSEMQTPPGASISDIVVALNALARISSLLNQTIAGILPRVTGNFTLSTNANTTVSQTQVTANSIISWVPTDASAATLSGSGASPYLSARNAGSNFVVTTANGSSPAGTETYSYWLWNPV